MKTIIDLYSPILEEDGRRNVFRQILGCYRCYSCSSAILTFFVTSIEQSLPTSQLIVFSLTDNFVEKRQKLDKN